MKFNMTKVVHAFALKNDIPPCLMISSPHVPFDPEMQRVVPLLGDSSH